MGIIASRASSSGSESAIGAVAGPSSGSGSRRKGGKLNWRGGFVRTSAHKLVRSGTLKQYTKNITFEMQPEHIGQ